MAGEWVVAFFDKVGVPVGDFRPNDLHVELVNSDEGPFSFELPLGDPLLRKDHFAPWKHSATIYRVNNTTGGSLPLTAGPVTARNLADERDTLLVSCTSWEGYLKRRIYPFSQDYYLTRDWTKWPKQWPTPGDVAPDLKDIVEDILQAMIDEDPVNTPLFVMGNVPTGQTGTYKIYPGDSTWIYDHIKALSTQSEKYGFEFDIDPVTLEIRLYHPDRDSGNPVYTFRVSEDSTTGEFHVLDWTDEGPKATWTLGLGTGTDSNGLKLAGTDNYDPLYREFWRTDQVVDFGNVANQDVIDAMTSREGYLARFQQKKVRLELASTDALSKSFWLGGRPRNLIGNRIRVIHDFGYHYVDAYHKVQRLTIDVDNDGNDIVLFDLEQIYE